MATGEITTPERTILVQRVEVEKTGRKGDKPWTLYKVHATELDGTPITDELRTFYALDAGEVTVTADAYVKDNQIQHYTIKPKSTRRHGGEGNGAAAELASLRKRVDKLERQISAIIRAEGIEA